MKKITFMACAALLTSMIALNSCKSDEPGGNPNLNDGDVVKTEFAISLPGQAVGPNRMPAATVQTEGIDNFQGMKSLFLVPFVEQNAIEKTENRLGANIHLSDLVKDDIKDAKSHAKVYSDLSIPLTTGSFLFYAKSARTEGGKAANGSLVLVDTAANTPESFQFQLDPILTSEKTSEMNTKATQLKTYLSNIANVTDGKATPVAWKDYPADSSALKAMYDTYISMTGLSTFEISRVLTDMYKSLKPRRSTSPLANAIMTAIEAPTWAGPDANDTIRLEDPYDNFPAEYGIPEGSYMIAWDPDATPSPAFVDGSYSGKAQLASYVYPAQLWYYANSTIVTANKSMANEYTDGRYWKDILALYDAESAPKAVNTLTRSVAIKDTIQYAVARLDVTVKLHKDTVALVDNSLEYEGVKTDVPVVGDGFPVTAVLIGGQKHVGFDFAPITSDEYTIFDNVLANTMRVKNSTPSNVNHTLVLQNGGDEVMIAIELINNSGQDFYGVGGQIVPKNGKFYVCGKLFADTRSGADKTGGLVFKKDFTTTARLSLKSLKNAYNTIPDLRTPQLELGFAVDLTWQEGNAYDVEL